MPCLRLLTASILLAFGLTACGGGGSGSNSSSSSSSTTSNSTSSSSTSSSSSDASSSSTSSSSSSDSSASSSTSSSSGSVSSSSSSSSSASSSSSSATTATSGVLVDDLISGATVFCDTNGNGQLDSGEASATTDDSGLYTFGTACSAQIASVAGTGYDISTMKAPKSHYRARAGSRVLSPFTSLQVAGNLSDSSVQTLLARLGLAGVDPADFNPVTDGSRATTAAAITKILNDIADITETAGGDPASAFQAALAGMATYLQNHGGTVFDSDTSLGDLIEAAAQAGFKAGLSSSTWNESARSNAAQLTRIGLTTLARTIRNHSSLAAARDDFNNGAINGIISETDLNDSSQVSTARGRCGDKENIGKAQYVYSDADTFTFVAGTGSKTFTIQQLDAGISMAGHSLASLQRLELPLRGTALALPKNGTRVAIALQVQDVSGNRLLQVSIDKVLLKRDSNGVLKAAITADSQLDFYARTSDGVEVGSGRNPYRNLDGSLLTSGQTGIGIDLQKLAAGMKGRLPNDTALLDRLLNATGQFKLRVVVTELDLRRANATRFSVQSVAVKVPGISNRVVRVVTGAGVLGHVTF